MNPIGIRVSKYILGLVAVFDLGVISFLRITLGGFLSRQNLLLGCMAALLVNALWAFLTAIGIARHRRWARWSILVRAGLYAVVGCVGTGSEVVSRVHSGANPVSSLAASYLLVAVALLFPAMGATGIWWLVYFTRPSTRELFRNTAG